MQMSSIGKMTTVVHRENDNGRVRITLPVRLVCRATVTSGRKKGCLGLFIKLKLRKFQTTPRDRLKDEKYQQ